MAKRALPLLLCWFFLLPIVLPNPAKADAIERVRKLEKLEHGGREYFNYDMLLSRAGASSLPLIRLKDILLEPRPKGDFALHSELLERLHGRNISRFFFVVDIPPYFPEQRYDRTPWGRTKNYTHFGNSFWRNPGRISSVYRRVYGNASPDFNSQMRRVKQYVELGKPPRAVVFARMERTTANSQWRSAWGWDHYYYFLGEDILLP